MRSVQKVSSHVLWKIDIFWTRYKNIVLGQRCLSPLQRRHLGTSRSSPSIFSTVQNTLQHPLLESPSAALLYFPQSHWWLKSLPFKDDFSFGKSLKSKGAKSGLLRGWVLHSQVFCLKAFQNSDHFQQILDHLWSIWATFLFVLHSFHCPWKPPELSNNFCRGMFKLNAKFDADSFLYLLDHFECQGHTVHVLPQQYLLSPLTGIVTSSLFTQVHSSPLSLAAVLHWCHANRSHYINNGWNFSGQALYIQNASKDILPVNQYISYIEASIPVQQKQNTSTLK